MVEFLSINSCTFECADFGSLEQVGLARNQLWFGQLSCGFVPCQQSVNSGSFAEINRRGSLCNYLSVSYISEVHVEGWRRLTILIICHKGKGNASRQLQLLLMPRLTKSINFSILLILDKYRVMLVINFSNFN
ncbi:hypothetical protein ACS0TY_029792 [Phlomoides rotata]